MHGDAVRGQVARCGCRPRRGSSAARRRRRGRGDVEGVRQRADRDRRSRRCPRGSRSARCARTPCEVTAPTFGCGLQHLRHRRDARRAGHRLDVASATKPSSAFWSARPPSRPAGRRPRPRAARRRAPRRPSRTRRRARDPSSSRIASGRIVSRSPWLAGARLEQPREPVAEVARRPVVRPRGSGGGQSSQDGHDRHDTTHADPLPSSFATAGIVGRADERRTRTRPSGYRARARDPGDAS